MHVQAVVTPFRLSYTVRFLILAPLSISSPQSTDPVLPFVCVGNCLIFVQFGIGVLDIQLSNVLEFREYRLADIHTELKRIAYRSLFLSDCGEIRHVMLGVSLNLAQGKARFITSGRKRMFTGFYVFVIQFE